MVRERQLELAVASSMAVLSGLASAPLLWIYWLSGKSVQLVIRRTWIGNLGMLTTEEKCMS